MELEEASLRVTGARESRLEAFERLVREHERMVLRTAWRMLGRKEDAQDAAQEVFLKVHRHFERLDEARDVPAWLHRLTVNVCYDALRRRKPVLPVTVEPAQAARQYETIDAAERRELLERGLETLGEKERAALVLRDIEGLETARVAEILGTAEGTVRSHVSTARAKLRRFVESQGYPL